MIRLNKILLLCCIIFCVAGCNQKSDKKTEEKTIEKVVERPELERFFSLNLEAIVENEDVFSLFYTQYEGENFSPDQMINTKVYPSNEAQTITFKLPETDYPLNLRLDFGSNSIQGNIKILECDLKYFNSSYKIKGSELSNYFYFNEGVEIFSDSLTFKLKTFKNESGEKYDPYIVGNSKCIRVLQQEI